MYEPNTISLCNSNADDLTQIFSDTTWWEHNRVTVRYERSGLRFARRGKKLKCTLVQALRLCTGCTAHRGSRSIALLFHDHGTRRGWGVSVTPRPLFTPGKDPVSVVQEAGWAAGPVWTGAENLASTGIRFPDRPARSQPLYRLRYPAHINCAGVCRNCRGSAAEKVTTITRVFLWRGT